jgi:hypothetical protein
MNMNDKKSEISRFEVSGKSTQNLQRELNFLPARQKQTMIKSEEAG